MLKVPYADLDAIAKLIPGPVQGNHIPLKNPSIPLSILIKEGFQLTKAASYSFNRNKALVAKFIKKDSHLIQL